MTESGPNWKQKTTHHRPRPLLLLAAAWLLCQPARGSDNDFRDVLAILQHCSAPNELAIRFELYGGSCDELRDLDFSVVGIPKVASGRFWRSRDSSLVEFLNNDELTVVGKGSRFNDLAEAVAVSGSNTYRFTAVGSTLTPYANLRVEQAATSNIPGYIDKHVLMYLKAITHIGGFAIEAALAHPNCTVVRSSDGVYHVKVIHNGPPGPSSLSMSIRRDQSEVVCDTEFCSGEGNSRLCIAAKAMGQFEGERFTPLKVGRRLFGSGYGAPRCEVMLFSPMTADVAKEVVLPVDEEFFRRYQREYPIHHDDATEMSEYVNAVPREYMVHPQARLNTESGASARDSGGIRWGTILVALNAILGIVCLLYWRRMR